MSGPVDPTTGQTLPFDAIQRVLYVCHPVHVYAIPPLTSMKGYTAADWTVPDPNNKGQTRQIFTARLRILETEVPAPPPAPLNSSPGGRAPAVSPHTPPTNQTQQGEVKTDILLEDPNSGSLFAAAPYTDPSVVEHALDSSRFFAVRVVGDGRKAVLGIGFEDRSEAFDFGVALQEVRKVLGFTSDRAGPGQIPSTSSVDRGGAAGAGAGRDRHKMMVAGQRKQQSPLASKEEAAPTAPRDYSLKPGEMISVQIGRRRPEPGGSPDSPDTIASEDRKALFSILPPPGGPSASLVDEALGDSSGGFPLIPPPPSAKNVRRDRRRRPTSAVMVVEGTKENESQEHVDLGDGDGGGEFGEFQ